MKVKLKIEKEFDVKYLQVDAEVRYWENATVNGIEDSEDGGNIPCKESDSWKPFIDIDTGQILNWEQGKTADIHYKVCDAGIYTLLDENKNEITRREGYVPDIMCPAENGYGDYIIMRIDESGFIQNWDANKINEFSDNED